jgi:hypothetical protein
MRNSIIKSGLVIVAILFTYGCASFSDVNYPGGAPPPRDIGINADNNEHGLTVTLVTTNAVVLPSESFLTDGRGRRFSLHFDLLEANKDEPPYPRYHITAHGPVPLDSRLSFCEGLYIISIAYTNTAIAKHGQINRAFIINRQTVPYLILWMLNGH